ncbi:hypothetical protein [Alkalihalobacillus sp. R86527]|uniref:hypothetical protein n=1 Tax=Alkalihalobacillus sp. R86527 TaxID=3093863 RepID=UPI0036718328
MARMAIVLLFHIAAWSTLVVVLQLSSHDRLFFKAIMVVMFLYVIVASSIRVIPKMKTVAFVTGASTLAFILIQTLCHII